MPDLEEAWVAAQDTSGGPGRFLREDTAFTLFVIDKWLLDRSTESVRGMLLGRRYAENGRIQGSFGHRASASASVPGGCGRQDRIVDRRGFSRNGGSASTSVSASAKRVSAHRPGVRQRAKPNFWQGCDGRLGIPIACFVRDRFVPVRQVCLCGWRLFCGIGSDVPPQCQGGNRTDRFM